MSNPPTGTVTFLFTDIQGSTSMWERDAKMMQAALARHDEIMRGVVTEHGGHVFKMVGDACYAAFSSACLPRPIALEDCTGDARAAHPVLATAAAGAQVNTLRTRQRPDIRTVAD